MRTGKEIPKAKKAFIGGSSTYSINFPGELKLSGVKVLDRKVYATPFGESPEFTVLELDGDKMLTVRMHGWRAGTKRAEASKQVFWVLEQAGVDTIFAEGGVGSVSEDLDLCHFIVLDDYIDLSMRKDVCLSDKYLLVMRDPVCPDLAEILKRTSVDTFPDREASRGVYAVTDGRHFESRSEVKMIKALGADVIGQSLCPEVYLAREIGACYAGIYLVVNRAEGIGPDWSHAELKEIFYREALNVGRIIIESLRQLDRRKRETCQCSKLRKETLLAPRTTPSSP